MPNGLEKYMVFLLKKNLVFINSMKFMSSSLKKLVKNLSDNDFKYFIKEFGSKNLEVPKQKGVYPYEYKNSFKRFIEKKLPDKECFCRLTKYGIADNDGKKLDGHINDGEYQRCKKIGKYLT